MPAVKEKFEGGRLVLADARGRVNLGLEASAKSFTVVRASNGDYILTPMMHIPEREAWLWTDSTARASFERGLSEAAAGLGQVEDFSGYAMAELSEESDR